MEQVGISKQNDDTNAWFADSPFNLLVDYYPDIAFRPYGSGATRDNVLSVMKDLQPGCLIIYAKGHSGYTTFPSSLGTEHPMLAKDMLKFFREITRETNTKLFIYYSGLLSGEASRQHPEWRMLNREGQPFRWYNDAFLDEFVGYPLCPQSPYFDEWVAKHLEEIVTRYDPDGFWIDGDWPGPCYCPLCETRYREATGNTGAMPEMTMSTSEGRAWSRVWSQIKQEWRSRFQSTIKKLKPTCMYSAGNISARKEFQHLFDWRSGDWFSPMFHRLHMSMVFRRYTTLNLPYDAYTCDTVFIKEHPELRARTKTLARMLQEGATLLANGGSWGYWTYPMPNGAFVPSKMRIASKAAEFARKRKNVSLHTHSVGWTAILDSEPSDNLITEGGRTMGAGKALIALHRSPDVIDEATLSSDSPYDLIVVPEQKTIDDETVDKLKAFVKEGGRLLTTGSISHSQKLQELLGVRLVQEGATDDGHVFLKTGDPVGIYSLWDKLELCEAEELYPLYLSWDHDNPQAEKIPPMWPIHGMVDEENPEAAGYPAATIRKLGKGMIVHIPAPFFSVYWEYGNPDMLGWFKEIVDLMQPTPLFNTDAPCFVEVSLRKKNNVLLIHLVNGNPGRDTTLVGSKDYWVDDIPPIGPINCEIRCANKPEEIFWEPDHKKLKYKHDEGILRVEVPSLEIHGCIAVSPWERPGT